MTTPWLCWREDVTQALDYQTTSRDYRQIDRAIGAATDTITNLLHRPDIYPTRDTRYFPWPHPDYGRSYILWLDANELVSVTTLVAGGVTIPSTDYYLEPQQYGPPYNRIEINLGTSSAFGGGNTWQRNIAVTADYGLTNATTLAGTLTSAVSSTSATTLAVSDGSTVGVGAVLLIDSERLLVTDRAWASTADTATLTAVNNAVTITGLSGTYHPGEVLLIDSERVLVTDQSGSTVTVKRAWDGTTLAAHTAATINVSRTLTVTRGALGSTAATHTSSTPVYVYDVPGVIRSLAVAEAVLQVQREQAGYTVTHRGKTLGASGDSSGSGGGQISVAAIDDMRAAAYSVFGRKSRTRTV